MEEVSFRNARGKRLAGSLFPAGNDLIVVMAHGFASNRDSRGRFPTAAGALNAAGISALTFDFCGCGESDDDTLSIAKHVGDLHSAIAFVRSSGYRRVALWGHSLGGLICLQGHPPGIAAMILTGTPTGPVTYNWSEFFSTSQCEELARTGILTADGGGRPGRVVIERGLLDHFSLLDQGALLRPIACPVLLIHGDGDEEERMLLTLSRTAINQLPVGSRLEVVPGAGHSLLKSFDSVVSSAIAWLLEITGSKNSP